MRRALLTLLFLAGLFFHSGASGQAPKDKGKPKFTNRLARETSPYLLMHAHNPTDWYAWGPEAFEKAKKEGKLIFLSIGYSSCFWCHVMERESFNNEKIAKVLNDSFVCIKVDREERPDIDQIYMTSLSMLRQSGGWPLSMFLMPDGRPIVGGTYWPPEDKKVDGGVHKGFSTICNFVQKAWKDSPKEVEEQAEKLATATTLALENNKGLAIVRLDRKLLAEAVDSLKDEFDPEYGGFGNPDRQFKGTKFPLPSRLEFLLQQGERTKNKELIDMVSLTLDRMALGGIYDHLGGGFHRYSTERTWNVPHFEKMLYDNAQLAEVYARAYRVTGKKHYGRILEDTLAYVQREMMSPEGAFYSSQDAETHHEEGRFYVWTPEELAAALPVKEELDFIRKVYGAAGRPNFEGKYHILHLSRTPFDLAKDMKIGVEDFYARLTPLRKKLFQARGQRDKPFLNKIALTAWSGQMIAGFAEAGMALGAKKYTETAARTADFVLKHQRTKEGRLLRTYGARPGEAPRAAVNGYLEDYAFFVHGLLALHDATKEKKWLDASRELTDSMIQHHGDKKVGGYYFTAHDHEKFFARSKDQYDGAQPSGNSIAARNLVRLWTKTGEEKYRAEAERTFRFFVGSLKSYPSGLTGMAYALDLFVEAADKAADKAGGQDKETKSALESDPSGWVDLLTDAELKDWKRVAIPPGSKLSKKNAWSVSGEGKDKVLVCDGVGVHEMLLHDKELADGIFHIEWRFKKLDPKKGGYNSGVYVRNSADGAVWHQAQVGSKNVGNIFGSTLVDGKPKGIPGNKKPGPQRGKEAGEWNTYEITCKGKAITLWINGAATAEWTTCEVARGYFGVEAEGYVIEFKNIKFKELK